MASTRRSGVRRWVAARRELDHDWEGGAAPLSEVVALPVLVDQQLACALVFSRTRPEDAGRPGVRLVAQLDRDPRVRLEVAHPVGPLPAAGQQVQAPILGSEPELDAMGPTRPTPDRGQVRIRFAGPSRQPLLRSPLARHGCELPCPHGRRSTLMARRSSIARYPSATWSSGSVRSNTLPGLIFLWHTRSIRWGRKRRTGAGPPNRCTSAKNSSSPGNCTSWETPT